MGNSKGSKRRKRTLWLVLFEFIIFSTLLLVLIYIIIKDPLKSGNEGKADINNGDSRVEDINDLNLNNVKDETEVSEAVQLSLFQAKVDKVIEESNGLATAYYYEEAMSKLVEIEEEYQALYGISSKIQEAKRLLEDKTNELTHLGAYTRVEEVNHIFFHSLIADTDRAFDGDSDANGYNYYMTTTSEFIEMMLQMYNDNYVMVSMSDLVKPVKQEDGTIIMEEGQILLPPNKKPFVLSQDDVNYYDYMEGDGFADKIVIDENGRARTEMTLEDGSLVVGDYDIVPIIERFLEVYPDFSYKGARGILALTGYEGALGYRTNDSTSPTYEEDKAAVKEVAEVLKDLGWEFASHSWGHRDMNKYSYNFLIEDTNRWLEEVGALIGHTDIYIFPFGIDIENAGGYKGEKYQYLKDKGFLYYCGVYKDPWMERTKDYVRMTRRPLDGQAMLQYPERLQDLFDLDKLIDPERPPLG